VIFDEDFDSESNASEDYEVEESSHEHVIGGGGTLATLSSKPQFLTIKVSRKVEGEKIVVLIDGGTTHNFIDESFVDNKRIKNEPFAGFNVATSKGDISPCTKLVKQFKVSLDNYEVIDDFYVFPKGGIPHVVLGA